MSARDPDRSIPPPEPDAPGGPGDDEYARGYSEGYGEGLREALKEILQNASRGHTAQELRFLVESRLARVGEDVERKRRSLLGPPRRPAWGPLLRAPRPAEPTILGAVAVVPMRPGETVLVRESRPGQAVGLLDQSAPAFARVFLISNRPPAAAAARGATVLSVGPASGDPTRPGLSPGEIAGRIREAAEGGPVLVYLDAFERLATEYSLETSLKFVQWTSEEAAAKRLAFLASVDPASLEPKDLGRLQRAFQSVR